LGGSINWIVIFLFFIGGAVFTGYMPESSFLWMNALLYIGFVVVLWFQRSITIAWVHIPIVTLVASYWVSCVYAVDLEAAILEASRVSSLIPLSLMLTMLVRGKVLQIISYWPWMGVFLVVIGNAFQLFREGRLESTIQYANALALIFLVNILISLLSFAKVKSYLQLVLLTVNATGLLLTFSRSVWILWMISVVVIILVIPQIRTKTSMLLLFSCHLLSLIIAMLIKQDILFFLNRVSSIQTKTSEFQIRLVYWKDSIRMFFDYWLGGSGGGGWSILQYDYQSREYYVKFIHNHYVQILLDVGLIGSLCWFALIVLFYKDAVSQLKSIDHSGKILIKGTMILVTVILLHAGFDFDLTFPLIFGMLICLMMISRNIRELSINGYKLAAAISFGTLVAIFFTWMASAYLWKEQGIRAVRHNQLEYALNKFDRAEKAIPWSSSMLYESSKVYVRMGNKTGDMQLYDLAEKKILEARSKEPRQKLYTDLLDSLNDGK